MRSRNKRAPLIVTAIAGAILLSAAGAAVLVAEQERVALSDERGVLEAELTEASAQHEAEAKAAAERKAAADRRALEEDLRQDEVDYWAEQGFESAGHEGIWWRFAEDSEFSCGYFSCVAVVVVASGGQCPSSVFVQANTLHGGVVTGRVTGMIGSLREGDTGSTVLEATDDPDTFEVTAINCY